MSKLFRVFSALILITASAFAGEVTSTFFGMHILHAVNGSTAWPSDQFGGVRLWDSGVDWHEINTAQGVYDWSAFDRWMTLAQQHNVDVVYTFGRVPNWANGGQGTTAPMTNMQYWDDYVRAIATRSAGRVKYWEIWNEPNDTHFWSGDIPTLVIMAQHAYQIIKSVDPNAVIVSPSPTWTSTSPDQWMNSYLQAGGGKYADVIAFHGYVNASPESIDSLAAAVAKVMNANGQSGKPLWDTEASWSLADSCSASICDQDQQAAFLVRHYMLHLSRNVERYYWYAWEDSWGTLWSSGGVQKPGIAYKQVYNWLVGATLSQACTSSGGTWTCGITRPNGYQGLVVWNPSSSVSFTAPSQYKQSRDIYGSMAAVPANGVVTVNFKPILLETTGKQPSQSAPTAMLNVSPQSGTAPVTVNADSSASSDSDGTIVSRSIDFGDGFVAPNVVTAAHSFTRAGTYTVTLSVADNSGLISKTSKSVTVSAPATCTSSLKVNVSSPLNNSSVSSPTRFVANATSGCSINAIRVYLDGQGVYTVNGGLLDTSLNLTDGTHNVVVQAWDSTNAVAKSALTIKVVPSCTSSPTVNIASPLGGYSLPNPLLVVAAATSGCSITKTTVSVDGFPVSTIASGSVSTPLNLATGNHSVSVQTWDSTGATASSAVNISAVDLNSCQINTANRTITICYPLANSTVPRSFRIVAGASATLGVKSMKIYLDNVPVHLVNAGKIDATITIAPGTHNLVVQAWDNSEAVFKSARTIAVK
jgi:PKD repeat protein